MSHRKQIKALPGTADQGPAWLTDLPRIMQEACGRVENETWMLNQTDRENCTLEIYTGAFTIASKQLLA